MFLKSVRLLVLATFLIVAISSPVLALCESGSDPGCCCTKDRKCPRPTTSKALAEACCKSSTPAVPAPSGTPDRGASPSADGTPADVANIGPAAPQARFRQDSHPAADKNASGIGLYTLHASFLI